MSKKSPLVIQSMHVAVHLCIFSNVFHSGVTIKIEGDFVWLDWGAGIRIKWDLESTWYLTIFDTYNHVNNHDGIQGLCGDFDGDPTSKMHILMSNQHDVFITISIDFTYLNICP